MADEERLYAKSEATYCNLYFGVERHGLETTVKHEKMRC